MNGNARSTGVDKMHQLGTYGSQKASLEERFLVVGEENNVVGKKIEGDGEGLR